MKSVYFILWYLKSAAKVQQKNEIRKYLGKKMSKKKLLSVDEVAGEAGENDEEDGVAK